MAGKNAEQVAAEPYTPAFLAVYDWWVIRLSDRYAWRCPAEEMLKAYNAHLGHKHLEVGPGSGWFLANTSTITPDSTVTLLDLNPTPLEHTRRRVQAKGCTVNTVTSSVLEPLPDTAGDGYDSVGINFVFHCLPGSFADKGVAFEYLARVLTDDGVLFGSTILNQRPATWFGRALTSAYTRAGAFNNAADDRPGLEAALRAAFTEVELTDIGDVTNFIARGPRR
ncbi:class I SAM-dependent methyltransferase [Nocardia otitidiscaviarum]|uniref:class I SAM-dependent methyltransferase n=1 Tax=Nocardia otitidiscaviarum TaxID=1823 RepID=UPI0004A6BF20|nr:class I SAM-dependent methyltransferase [Nocardia otitidiscaviarum]MBF6137742.1 class I SAM-dependent methyltransferase [Nocardia otitidiscaviarum]MBF6485263.1 class I SAM-dependent methyltransferase [Nocardia otitidiscaviarum]